jgi:hypothetical protein
MMLAVSNSFTRYRVMFQILKDLLGQPIFSLLTLLYSCQSTHKSSLQPNLRAIEICTARCPIVFDIRRLIGFISRIHTTIIIRHTQTERATLMLILLLLMLLVMQWYLLLLTAVIPSPFRPLGTSAT